MEGKIIKGKRRTKRPSKSKHELQKEEYIQTLIKMFEESGYEVRRERLKRGHGWTVQSGMCAVFGEKTLFLDRNLSVEDQLEVLLSKFREAGLNSDEKLLSSLPEPLQRVLTVESLQSVA